MKRFISISCYDPDRNKLQFQWWLYEEPSNYRGCILFKDDQASQTSFTIPAGAKGKILHITILEVTGNDSACSNQLPEGNH